MDGALSPYQSKPDVNNSHGLPLAHWAGCTLACMFTRNPGNLCRHSQQPSRTSGMAHTWPLPPGCPGLRFHQPGRRPCVFPEREWKNLAGSRATGNRGHTNKLKTIDTDMKGITQKLGEIGELRS